MISGKATAALASGLIVAAAILSLGFGVFRPSSNGATPERPVANPATTTVPAPALMAETVASPAPPSPGVASEVLGTITNALATATERVSAPVGSGGPQVGIKVHGNWAIEVRQADGSIVSRREFANALEQTGGGRLVGFLSRGSTFGWWSLSLEGDGEATQPCLEGAQTVSCLITEPRDTSSGLTSVFKNLSVTSNVVGGVSRLVLSGTATVQRNGNISRVGTTANTCSASVAPLDCTGTKSNGYAAFTSVALGSPINVVNGQSVVVTMTISFS